MDPRAATTVYARWAPIYDQTFGAITQAARRAAVRKVTGPEGTRVLEVGVGTGLSLPLLPRHMKVTGVDYSAEMLAQAERRVARLKLPHIETLQRMDARQLGFADGSFDRVVAMHMISVVPEPERVMREIVRVLKPGGQLIMSNHFAKKDGPMAHLSRRTAKFADRIGWHSDFDISVVLDTPGLKLLERRALPPVGMMTLLVLERCDAPSPANDPARPKR
ncbi:class I SAM-dependent methyltransferase [Yangia mangrovi]|uniref:SAM-dependent methyltransferase n=1 Tax=Alloyangia mangrovi TaxID=1779329 RepID=A0A2A3JWQ1_9RHOB|nr:class I SAM-dependent methyltransferase [Alloyangia mangrovi]MCA0939533.1 class I SAM-dependent methyltransferase [Alloyangia pacifica]MCA0943445.1 class I SAM-dependent methyltransferase [Alloyangia pacifica]MCT4370707.1 class I SAM-dependent methyltransferase [Alloyangia mangrovi]